MDKITFDNIVNRLSGIGQCRGPLFWLISKVEMTNPHVILELGTGMGGSLKVWEQIVRPNDLVISVDIRDDLDRIIWNYKNSDRNIRLISGDTLDKNTTKLVKQSLEGKEVDFLLIDAGHSYECVSNDFVEYSPFVRRGGLIGFHDLNDMSNVGKFFDELKGDKETSKSWMRPYAGPLNTLPDKVGDDKFMNDLKQIINENEHLTRGENGIICTGIYWKP